MTADLSDQKKWATLATPAALMLLLIFFALARQFSATNSQTSDEAIHLSAGYSYLATGDFRINLEHPPLIKTLSALPVYWRYHLPWAPDDKLWNGVGSNPEAEWLLGENFLYRSAVASRQLLIQGRLFNVLLGTLLVALVGWWGYRLWGGGAALVGMTLAAFDPNLIAHSSLITTDTGAALFIFLAVYLLWEYLRRPRWSLIVGIGVSTGLALLAKFSGVLVIGILGALVAIEILRGTQVALPLQRWVMSDPPPAGPLTSRVLLRRISGGTMMIGLIIMIAVLVIPAGYRFQGLSTWWEGFTTVMLHQSTGHDAFLFGKYSDTGWWYYYPAAFLVKTPVGTLMLIGLAMLFPTRSLRLTVRDASFVLVPVVLFMAVMMKSHVNIGLRHILPVYPFLFVFASRVGAMRFPSRVVGALAMAIPLGMTITSSLRIAPHQLAYFNEAVGGASQGINYLSDSNIDWGQDLWGLEEYLQSQHVRMIEMACFGNWLGSTITFRFQQLPAIGPLNGMPPDLVPVDEPKQLLAVSVTNLQGMYFPYRTVYSWLRERTPVTTIGNSIYVYDITHDADAHIRLAKLYLEDSGQQRFARAELEKAVVIAPTNTEAAEMLRALPVDEQ